MLYVIIGAAIIIALLGAAVKVESARVETYKSRATTAEGANKALDADCKKKFADASVKWLDQARLDKLAQDNARKVIADAKKKSAGQESKIAMLTAQANAPAAVTRMEQCDRAEKTLQELAKDRP